MVSDNFFLLYFALPSNICLRCYILQGLWKFWGRFFKGGRFFFTIDTKGSSFLANKEVNLCVDHSSTTKWW